MGILETFSKRKKKLAKQDQADVYQYKNLPEAFRIQILHIWRRSIGPYIDYEKRESNKVWATIHDALASELGKFELGTKGDHCERCADHLLRGETDDALDIIEISFRAIDQYIRNLNDYVQERCGITQSADSAVEELNHRFREHGIGYQYVDGNLIQVDSQYIHAEVVKPALSLLHSVGFEGAAEEFLKAHEHYRNGRHKEAINEALKAFESTMKTICDARRWSYPSNATAYPLIQILLDKELIPKPLLSEFTALRTLLESGLPTVRNTSTSSHGQGATAVSVPDHIVAFALHLAAANIVFLVEAHRSLK